MFEFSTKCLLLHNLFSFVFKPHIFGTKFYFFNNFMQKKLFSVAIISVPTAALNIRFFSSFFEMFLETFEEVLSSI